MRRHDGEPGSTAALANTTGAQRTLVILVNSSSNPVQPYTASAARSVVFTTASNFDLENSYQQTWLTGDVVGWYTVPLANLCDYPTLATQAEAAATLAGVNLANYAHRVYAIPESYCGWWGLGSVGGSPSQAWINGSAEGEAAIRAAGLYATFVRPWYVLGPGHRWPYALLPDYWLLSRFPPTAETSRRLFPVPLDRLVALVRSIENTATGIRIVESPEIRQATLSD